MIDKILELSIIIAIIAIPARAAREKNPRLGVRKFIINMLIFDAFYVFAMRFLRGRF